MIPFGPEIKIVGVRTWMQMTDLNIGVLFILAMSSMGVYGIALAGWASNNKYALLGGLRSSAQMISYELPMALAHRRAAADAEYAEPARDGGDAGRLLFRLHAALEHSSRAVPADLQLHHVPDLRRSPKPTACRSICPKPKTNWWPASTPNTAA